MVKNQDKAVDNKQQVEDKVMKRTIKDSVFTNLFQDKKYLIQLYRALHPKDMDVTEDDLTNITIKNILTDGIYNDLGFAVGDKFIIMVECQSTWTMNIIIRVLMYLVQSWIDYFERTNQNLYKSKKVKMPVPELYVIYTGERKTKPRQISLSKEFFDGKRCCIDVKVKMIYDGKKGNIINQYVTFTKICNEQVTLYGRTKKAILETIRICKDKNVLKEYLKSREREVVDIMMALYDEEEIMRSYIKSEVQEGIQEGIQEAVQVAVQEAVQVAVQEAVRKTKQEERKEANIASAKRMLKRGKLSIEEIAEDTNLSLETVVELQRQKEL